MTITMEGTTLEPKPEQARAPRRRLEREPFQLRRMLTVAGCDLRQLAGSKDYWIPMAALGAIFFVVIPTIVLLGITRLGDIHMVQQISKTLEILPQSAQRQIQGTSARGRTTFALSVFLFAPVAVIVPLTISTAVGAATLVGERERGTGEFLAHSPATAREIYLGKVLASLVPGYITTIVGFGAYSLVVDLVAGPAVGRWFFPTAQWWVLMFWVIPPFLCFTLSLVLRLSARVKSTAAAQQASGLVTLPLIAVAYAQSTGALFGAKVSGFWIGLVAWAIALFSLYRGVRSVTRARLLGVANEV
jgi:ABC-type transport system involved in multi-copper enzyme maturation permease subunit